MFSEDQHFFLTDEPARKKGKHYCDAYDCVNDLTSTYVWFSQRVCLVHQYHVNTDVEINSVHVSGFNNEIVAYSFLP